MKKNFKKGDKVVMHTCGEADHYLGKVWKCRSDSFMDSANQEVVFLHGFGGHFLCEFLQVVKPEIGDRFFLEEIVHRIKNDDQEYFHTLSKDWLKEMIQELPITEEERSEYLEKQGMDQSFIESAYFKSEEAMAEYLNIKKD